MWFIHLIKSLDIPSLGTNFGTVFNSEDTVIFLIGKRVLVLQSDRKCALRAHGACCFHLLENTRKRDRTLETKQFWWVQASATHVEFDDRMQQWEQRAPAAMQYLP